jgi:DNA-binding NarL/FixJ family response regulator
VRQVEDHFLVVEDDPRLGRFVAQTLRPRTAVLVRTIREALTQLSVPGLVGLIVDVQLPDGQGLDVIAKARVARIAAPAIILATKVDPQAINAAYDFAAGYLVKPIPGARIELFATRAASASRPVFEYVHGAVRAWCIQHGLSEAEADILRRAALGEDRESIAVARQASPATVQKQVSSLLRRTGHLNLQAAVAQLLRDRPN